MLMASRSGSGPSVAGSQAVSGRSGTSGTSGSGTASGSGTQTATPAQPTPTPATPARPRNGTYFFTPRLRVNQAGVAKNLYIDRIVVQGQYFTIFFTGGPTGRASDGDYSNFWSDHGAISLENLDNPGRPFNPINQGEDDDRNDPIATDGFYLMFQGVTGTRFSLTSTREIPPWSFDEIILGEPR